MDEGVLCAREQLRGRTEPAGPGGPSRGRQCRVRGKGATPAWAHTGCHAPGWQDAGWDSRGHCTRGRTLRGHRTGAAAPRHSQPYLSRLRRQVQRVDPPRVSVDLGAQDAARRLVQPDLPVAVAGGHDPVPQRHGGAGAAGHRAPLTSAPPPQAPRRGLVPGGPSCRPPALTRHRGPAGTSPAVPGRRGVTRHPQAHPKAGILLRRVNSSPVLQVQRVPASSAVTRSPAPSCKAEAAQPGSADSQRAEGSGCPAAGGAGAAAKQSQSRASAAPELLTRSTAGPGSHAASRFQHAHVWQSQLHVLSRTGASPRAAPALGTSPHLTGAGVPGPGSRAPSKPGCRARERLLGTGRGTRQNSFHGNQRCIQADWEPALSN